MKTLVLALVLMAVNAFADGEKLATVDTPAGPVSGLIGTTFTPPERKADQPVTTWAVVAQSLEAALWDDFGSNITSEKGDALPLVRVCEVAGLPPEVRDELRGLKRVAEIEFGGRVAYLPLECVVFVPADSMPAILTADYAKSVEAYKQACAAAAANEAKQAAAERRQERKAERAEKNRIAAERGREWLAQQQGIQSLERTREAIESLRQQFERARYGK